MSLSRRSILSALGVALPFGIAARARGAATGMVAPMLRFRPFEEAVREAFMDVTGCSEGAGAHVLACRRVEVGYCEEIRAGVQGCHNDRPFAGFPAGHLRIIRSATEPGPA